ncbi:MAG TPA: extensin family protein [Polyangiaceae bacterium]|nr:extensin family protein [Polyangiaceae bacterium]
MPEQVGPAAANPAAASAPASGSAAASAPAPGSPAASSPAQRGWADLDPTNDFVVAPPDAVERCDELLRERGVTFRAAELPLRQGPKGAFVCGAPDAVVYTRGPTGMRLSPPATMTCRMALALADVEELVQELAQRELGKKVVRLTHVGTYNCRKMVRFDYVSEHSYGNAIDLSEFQLEDGRRVNVAKHFGVLDQQPPDARSRFLRALGEQAFARDLVSVSLGPYWDKAHRDHFHIDMARYRVDGSHP